MAADDPRTNSSIDNPQSTEGGRVFVRLGWMVGGTLTMLIAWFTILSSPAWTFGLGDAVFWLGALVALTLRYLDVSHFQGLTSAGEPATMADFRRYAVGLTAFAGLGWTLAQAVHL